MISAQIDPMDGTQLILTFDAPYTTGGGQDASGTADNNFGSGSINFTSAADDTSMEMGQIVAPLVPGGNWELDSVTDMDFSPAVLTLPQSGIMT